MIYLDYNATTPVSRSRIAIVHTDAAQTVGKVHVNVNALGVKFYAPKGVGALYVKRGTKLTNVLAGAGHERGLRPGTENVAGIVGLGKACEIAERNLTADAMVLRSLTEQLLARLNARVEGLILHGAGAERLPNALFLTFPGVHGLPADQAIGPVRLSLGRNTTLEDVERAADMLSGAWKSITGSGGQSPHARAVC